MYYIPGDNFIMKSMRNTDVSLPMTKLFNQFGVKNADDIVLFLNSPAGIILQNLLKKESEHVKSLLEDLREHRLLSARKRALLFFLLGLRYDKDKAKQAFINEINAQRNEKILEELQHEPQASTPEDNKLAQYITETLEAYATASTSIEEQLVYTETLVPLLEQEWLAFEAELNAFYLEYPELILSMNPLQDKKIVEHEGQCYLLNPTDDIHDLSPENKAQAKLAYQHIKPKLEAHKKINEHYEAMCRRTDELQRTMLLLSNQLTQIQAAIVSLSAEPSLKLKPKVTPSQQPKAPAVAPAHPTQCMTLIYRLELLKIKHQPFVPVKAAHIEQQLKPGAPIPKESIQSLLLQLGRYDITLQTLRKNPQPLQQTSIPELKHPSPFSMRLKPKGAFPDKIKRVKPRRGE